MNVLISSVGRRVSLVRLFKQALRGLNVAGSVFAVDHHSHAPALHVADKGWTVPRVTDPVYVDRLIEICRENDIGLVVPTIDTELHILSGARDRFKAEDIFVLVCPDEVNDTSGDKCKTDAFFRQNAIPVPHQYELEEALNLSGEAYPLLLKPARGSSSVGVTRVDTLDELLFFSKYLDDPIIQEFVSGDEYTIDVLVGFDGRVCCAVPRLRIETRAGEVSKAMTVNDAVLVDWAYKVAGDMEGAVGCITLQCFRQSNGEVKFIEINPRFGGGFPLSAEAGADFPRWILKMLLGLPEDSGMQSCWHGGRVMLRYDDEIFLDKKEILT